MELERLPERVTVYEVGPRDGLQNEAQIISAEVKAAFVDALSLSGLPFIEVTSFVRPGMIPQLADAEEVLSRIQRREGVKYTALVPNERGMARAAETGLNGVAVFTAASETFSRRNTNAGIAETIERFKPVIRDARARGMWTRGYVSTAFGCPYEGDIQSSAVLDVAGQLLALGVEQVSIGDTIGVATPRQVVELLAALSSAVPIDRIALHFHDTRGTALANVLTGLQAGVTTFDTSAGGLGGCPYAPGASGNLATEDLLYMLAGLGVETGVSLERVVGASRLLAAATGRTPASRYFAAVTA